MDSADGGKSYFIDFKKNHQKGYVVIAERVNGNKRHNVVAISADLLVRLVKILGEGQAALDKTTPK